MGIKSVPEGLSGQPDVSLVSLRDGQRLSWDATNGKWVNGKEFITAPSITSPAAGATINGGGVSQTWTCSAFSSPTGLNLVWFDNDWEMSTSPAFDNVFYALYNQTGSATSVTAAPPNGFGSAFIRVRQNTVDQKGIWSAPVRVIIAQIQYFNTTGTFVVPANTNTVTPFLVGGGSGSSINNVVAGGGGGVTQPGAISVTPGASLTVTVGAGNSGTTAGGTSTFVSANAAGGAGTSTGQAGKASGNSQAGGAGSTNPNGVGGGGGGAGGPGSSGSGGGFPSGNSTMNAGGGGNGVTVTLDGVVRGGGGGGGSDRSSNNTYSWSPANAVAGHGGGNGAGGGTNSNSTNLGNSGTDGTGGGGGGNYSNSGGLTARGGNGVVILYYTF
jgi:hypothetical protein